MALTDIHTHILPDIDDGAATAEQSVKMLNILAEQKVGRVVLAPHFYPFKQSLSSFLKKRNEAVSLLKEQPLPKNIEILAAAEVHLNDALFNYESLDNVKIPQTNHILLELPASFGATTSEVKKIRKVIYNYNLAPILVHIERYPALLHNKNAMLELLDEGCKMQISANALQQLSFIQRKRLLYYLKQEMIHCIGTDCHDLSSRPPEYACHLTTLKSVIGEDAALSIAQAETIFEPM